MLNVQDIEMYLDSIREIAGCGIESLSTGDIKEVANVVAGIRSDVEEIAQRFESHGILVPSEYREGPRQVDDKTMKELEDLSDFGNDDQIPNP